jgi:hypothetical protein
MKALIKLGAASVLASGLFAAACSSDDAPMTGAGGAANDGGKGGNTGTAGKGSGGTTVGGGTGVGGTAGTATGGEAGIAGSGGEGGVVFPPAPALGSQIDRMGRPAVNTALTDPFDIVSGSTKDQVKDAYNSASDPSTWSTLFRGYIRQNLAILDGLDSSSAATGCGNQFAIGTATTGAGVSRYDALAGVLADDRLYVNTELAGSTLNCGQYLAVEANATNIVPNSDCGGRKPLYDVIDTSYSVLSIGMLSGVSDGVPTDGTPVNTFPFLGPPQ